MALAPNSTAGDGRKLVSADIPVPVPGDELDREPRWSKALTMTFDGPAGSGKSTIARLVAETLGFQFIDTGATYRALAWLALDRDIPLDDASRLRGLAIAQPASLGYEHGTWTVRIAGTDVTEAIREPRIDDAASRVAAHAEVRDVLVARQRQLSLARDCVLDGRDCGTNVRPDADLKVYVTADLDERIRRRASQQGVNTKQASALKERDKRDAPQSAPAADAITVDTTHSSIDETVQRVVERWLERRREILNPEITADRTAESWIAGDEGWDFETVQRRTSLIWRKGFRLRSVGVSRVPDRNCVFVANHASMWDPAFLINPLHRRIRYMGKFELTGLRVIRNLGESIGFFPVRRGSGDRVALHIAEEVLRRGDSLGIFPEGTRIYEGNLARPRQGAARLALITGVPIVPVAIYGNRWSASLFRVTVAFGRPHTTEGLRATPDNITELTNSVWSDVQEMWEALRADRLF